MEACIGNKSNCSEELKLPLALFAVERDSKKRLLFDVSSRKVRGINSSVFQDATCAFENGGWLLMIQHKSKYSQEQTLFLVHPCSGRRLDLPVVPSSDKGFFMFYINSCGTPLVVAHIVIWSLVPTIHIACPGDLYWSVYQHDAEPPCMSESMCKLVEPTCIVDVALLGTQAICLDRNGQIMIFSITEMTWRRMGSCPPECSERDHHFLVTSNGEAVLVSGSLMMENAFKFLKLNLEALEWSPLDDWELDDTSWFLRKGQSFCVKEVGKRKVYVFSGPEQFMKSLTENSNGTSAHDTLKSITNAYAFDLDDGSAEMLIPASIVTEVRHWIRPAVLTNPMQGKNIVFVKSGFTFPSLILHP